MSLPVCKFYSRNNKCKFGEHCRFEHSVNQKPPPLHPPGNENHEAIKSRSSAATSSVEHSLIQLKVGDHEDLVKQLTPSLNPSATPFHSIHDFKDNNDATVKDRTSRHYQSGAQRKVCQYFSQHGTCAFGRNCRFAHNIHDDKPKESGLSEQADKSQYKPRNLAPRFQKQIRKIKSSTVSNTIEDRSIKDEIKQNDLKSSQDTSLPDAKTKSTPRKCYLFKFGRCRWGKDCRFSHGKGSIDRKNITLESNSLNENEGLSQERKNASGITTNQENVGQKRNIVYRPPALKQVLKLDELEEDNDEFRQLDVNYLKKRFFSGNSKQDDDIKSDFILHAKFTPSDPDWPFDITSFNLEFSLPGSYPKEGMTVKVLGEDDFPETIRRYLEVSISEWLVERHANFAGQGKVELQARPFLRWLDRNIEDIVTEALKQLKRELIARASGLEFIPAEKLRARYNSESVSAEKGDRSESDDEETGSEQGSDDSSYSSNSNSESDEDEEERGPSLNLDPEKRGTEIALRNLQLKEKAASLLFDRLKLILQCSRCKNHEEVALVPGRVLSVTCGKCNQEMLATYRASLAHQFSSVIGYLDLENCTAFDLIFQECKAGVTCLNCSKQTQINGMVSGQLIEGWCQACHARYKIAIDTVKFYNLAPSGVDVSGGTKVDVVRQKTKKAPNDPQIKEGCPLPGFGTCRHYKHSYRWLRFPCCGKAYACDVCHDKKEDHDMIFANRMICGHCCKEQPYSATRPCNGCSGNLTKIHTTHWEGGTGCRNSITMGRNDTHKFKNMSKTISKHKQKVQSGSGSSKKKTIKLRHL